MPMERWNYLACALCVLCLLSCSLVGPRMSGRTRVLVATEEPAPSLVERATPEPELERAPAPAPAPRRLGGPHSPSAVEWIEARFLRYRSGLSRAQIRRVAETVVAEAERHGLDWELVLAVIRIESAFYNFARSEAGALGLMQIMPATGEELASELGIAWRGEETLFNPVTNVRMGTAYLRYLYRTFGRWDRALAAYNWGPGEIGRRLEVGEPLPTLYSTKVLALLPARRT
jgi:soluble lytic murein transglycosylase-like protein